MRLKHLLATVAAVATATTASPAAAEAPICRVAHVGDAFAAELCVTVSLGESGTTVAPTVWVTCRITYLEEFSPCTGTGRTFGTTGFVPASELPEPEVDPLTGSVRIREGSLGTVHVGGTAYDVPVPAFCVGEQAFCA